MFRLLCLLSLTTVAACTAAETRGDDDADRGDDGADDVLEIAVRRLHEGEEVDAFEAARDAFVEQLRAQPGVGADREFGAFLDFATFAEPTPPVFTGMTQYDDLDAFERAGEALGGGAEAAAFFGAFTPVAYSVFQPLDGYGPLDLAAVAADPDDVLEIAVRDLGAYGEFDAGAYAESRDAFLGLLTAQPGVVAEYQWVSVLDPDLVVGMTVYADAAAFQRLATDPALGEADEAAFLTAYPPAAGFVHGVVR